MPKFRVANNRMTILRVAVDVYQFNVMQIIHAICVDDILFPCGVVNYPPSGASPGGGSGNAI